MPKLYSKVAKWHGFEKGRALDAAKIDYPVALIMGRIGLQINKKEGEPSDNSGKIASPLFI